MKIGIVSPYYLDRYGGVQSHILATRDELLKKGHEVKIIAPKPRKNGHNQAEADLILIGGSAEVKFKALNTTFPVSYSLGPKEIDNLLAEEQFDVLHVHEPWMPGIAYKIVQKADCPVIGTLHANWPESIINKSFGRAAGGYFKTAAKNVHTLTAVSTEAGSYARKSIKKQIELVPNGIDLNYYSPDSVSEIESADKKKKSIVYVGRLEKRKGVIYLLKAYRLLRKRRADVELIIAGSGPTSSSLKAYVKRHKLPDVTFLGFIDDYSKKELLKAADVYCSPALYGESFGIVLLEAMAMGTVVVAGNNPGYTSVMSDRGRISLIDPTDSIEFEDRLDLLLFDDELRKLWLDWAENYVHQFDYSVITNSYEKLYKKAVA